MRTLLFPSEAQQQRQRARTEPTPSKLAAGTVRRRTKDDGRCCADGSPVVVQQTSPLEQVEQAVADAHARRGKRRVRSSMAILRRACLCYSCFRRCARCALWGVTRTPIVALSICDHDRFVSGSRVFDAPPPAAEMRLHHTVILLSRPGLSIECPLPCVTGFHMCE